jgi:hypothetical protein
MKKSALAVLSLAVVGTTLHAASAQAVGVAQIGWTDGSHANIRVSWPAHDGPTKVITKSPLVADRVLADQTTAGEVVVSKGALPQWQNTVVVEVRDATSNELVAQSAAFDTVASAYPNLDNPAKLAADGKITVSWTFTPVGADDTPKDPLDVPLTSARARITGTNGCTWRELPAVTGAHGSTVLPTQTPPFKVGTVADSEWGRVQDVGLAVVNLAVSQQVPASTPYGDYIRIPFTSDAIRPGKCTNGVAGTPYKVPVQTVVDLQARTTPTAGWSSLSGGILWPGGKPKVFGETSIGARQYRTVAFNTPAAANLVAGDPEVNWVVGFGAVTPAASAITPYKLGWAKFNQPTVTLGQKATAAIRVQPYSTVTATIQRWNGKGWANWSSVPVRSGDGAYSYKPTTRGTHTFRFLVPSSTYGKLKIDWIATPSFSLTVR